MNPVLEPDTRPLNAPLCPLCGGTNGCAAAAEGRFDVACWCRSARIHPDALAALPASARGKACLCPACARGKHPASPAQPG